MKRFILLSICQLLLCCAFAQQSVDSVVDIIYLKNKHSVQGVIIKNDLGIVRLKTMEDGKDKIVDIQHYDIDRIERMQLKDTQKVSASLPTQSYTRSELANIQPVSEAAPIKIQNETESRNKTSGGVPLVTMTNVPIKTGTPAVEDYDPFGPPPPVKSPLRRWTREIRGPRGFLDVGADFGVGNDKYNSVNFIGSGGFQFNPIFYLGLGTAYRLSTNKESSMPIFINPRLNMTDHELVNPYWDVKAGYSVLEAYGGYFSTSLGVSFVVGKRGQFALNVGIVYSYLDAHYKEDNFESKTRLKVEKDFHNIGFTTGFEF